MPYIDPSNPPTVFGVSGYSGAGTKTGENDEHGRPKTVPKIVSQLLIFETSAKLICSSAERRGLEGRHPTIRID
jgi:hypothetical protein